MKLGGVSNGLAFPISRELRRPFGHIDMKARSQKSGPNKLLSCLITIV